MAKRTLYQMDFLIDTEIIDDIKTLKEDVDNCYYKGWTWDEFVESALLTFSKMLDSKISPKLFDNYLAFREGSIPEEQATYTTQEAFDLASIAEMRTRQTICEHFHVSKIEELDEIVRIGHFYKKVNEEESGKSTKRDSIDDVIGHEKVKNKIKRLTCLAEKGLYTTKFNIANSMNYAFLGNPGTGKTMMARALANEFYEKGILPSCKVVETDRAALIGEYLGQTSPLVKKCFKDALGGVLIIDEAYTLGDNQSYANEALTEINKLMEDYRGQLVVVFSGYKKETLEMLEKNIGLKSRINGYFEFEDYTDEELKQILNLYAKKTKVVIDSDVSDRIIQLVSEKRGTNEYGNARDLRNIFEGVLEYWAFRTNDNIACNVIQIEDLDSWEKDNNDVRKNGH